MYTSTRLHATLVALSLAITLVAGAALAQAPSDKSDKSSATATKRERDTPDWVLAAAKQNAPVIGVRAPAAGSTAGFEQNLGQFDGDARYLARTSLGMFLLRPGVMTAVIAPPETLALPSGGKGNAAKASPPPPRPVQKPRVVDFTLTGANAKAEIRSEDLLPTRLGYFSGNDPKAWLRAVPAFRKVRYEQIYPEVDLVVYRGIEGVRYDFVVAPGGSPSAIRMTVAGADKIALDAVGNLVIGVGQAELRHSKPVLYQTRDGVRNKIDGDFALEGNLVWFRVGAYDRSLPLVIDPTVTEVFGNVLSGVPIGHAHGNATAVAPNGDLYFAGSANVFSSATTFSKDAFVTWLDADGTQRFTMFLSGKKTCGVTPNICDDDDVALALAVAPTGEIAVTGSTQSIDFPTTSDAFDSFCGIDKLCGRGVSLANPVHHHTFIVELRQETVFIQVGNTLTAVPGLAPVWASFFNPGSNDQGTGVAFDASGTIYVGGFSTFAMNSVMKSSGFLAAFNPTTAGKLVFNATLGNANGDGNVFVNAAAFDRVANRAYVVGSAAPVSSSDFPAADPLGTTATGGGSEAFVAAFDPAGTVLNTAFLRGSAGDVANGVAVDTTGGVYVAGTTNSTNFNGAGAATAGGTDVFVVKLHYTPRKRFGLSARLDYVTLLGGSNEDIGKGIAADVQGRAYITGSTRSSNFPTLGPALAPLRTSLSVGLCGTQNVQCPDAFLARLKADGSLDYSVLFGVASFDAGNGVALRNPGDAVVAGESFNATAMIPHFEATITRILAGTDLAVGQTCTPNPVDAGHILTCTVTVTNTGMDAAPGLMLAIQLSPAAWNEPLVALPATCATALDARGFILTARCPIVLLAAGASRSLTFPFIPADRGQFSSRATVAFNDDPDPSNNIADVTTTVVANTDLNVSLSHWPEPTPLGTPTNIELWIGNDGHDLAGGAQAQLDVPAGLEILSVTSPAACNPTSGTGPMTITCDAGYLVPNSALPGNQISPPTYPGYLSGPLAVGVKVVAVAKSVGTIRNLVRVSGALTDSNPGNDSMPDYINVFAGVPKIGAQMGVIRRTPTATGLQMEMEMEFKNAGDGNAYNVQLTAFNTVNIAGGGTATPITALPGVLFPYLGIGNAKSWLPSFSVNSSVTGFDVAFEGTSMDASGSAIPFKGQAHIVP